MRALLLHDFMTTLSTGIFDPLKKELGFLAVFFFFFLEAKEENDTSQTINICTYRTKRTIR